MTANHLKVKALNSVVRLQFDLAQAQLRKHAAEREATRALIAGLNRPALQDGDDPILNAKVDMMYRSWADGRRAELNMILARQTANWMESAAEARRCFGRLDALQQVAARMAARNAGPQVE